MRNDSTEAPSLSAPSHLSGQRLTSKLKRKITAPS
jgi:hypothetical protein